jgi:carbonic anhydrase
MSMKEISRRRLLAAAGGLGLSLPSGSVIGADLEDEHPGDPAASLQRLVEGNDRFARDAPRPQHVGREWRLRLTKQQHPYATILSCSDSRVPPELIFDEGFGDLFVIRVAGHVVAHDALGSLAYAADHLHTKLFVVMGHEDCGAVTAAVNSLLGQSNEAEHIESLLNLITPGLKQLNRQQPRWELITAAVEANVRRSMDHIAHCPQVAKLLEAKLARLVGAVYELETGRVRFLKPA